MMLQAKLEQLERGDLIRRAPIAPEIEYWFKHGLVQETVYDSLLKQDRKRLHSFVARSLQDAPASGTSDRALILAQHWQEAGELERALPYYIASGANAARVYANAEALFALDRARALAQRIPAAGEVLRELYRLRGRVLELSGDYQAALSNYIELEKLAVARADASLELQALIHQATLYATPNTLTDVQHSIQLSQRTLELARTLDDRAAQAKALWALMLAEYFGGHSEQAVTYGEQSLALARALNLREQLAYTLNDIVRPYTFVGRAADAFAARSEAETLWRELDNLPMLADNLTNVGTYATITGDYETALPFLHKGLQISKDIGNLWGQAYAEEILGMVYYPRGEWEKALRCLHDAARHGKQINFIDPQYTGLTFAALIYHELGATGRGIALMEQVTASLPPAPAWLCGARAMLAYLYADRGELPRARTMLEQARHVFNGVLDSPVPMILELAEFHLRFATGDLDGALTASRTLLDLIESTGIRAFSSLGFYLQGKSLEQMGRTEEAWDTLSRAHGEASATQTRSGAWEICAALARIETKRGNIAGANEWRVQAREAAQFIADRAPSEFRDLFLRRAGGA